MNNYFRKSHRIARAFMMVLILLVIAAVLTQTSFAKQLGQILGLDPDEGTSLSGQTAKSPQELQPDENGYTGPQSVGSGAELGWEGGPDDLFTAPRSAITNAPDTNGYQGELPAPVAPSPITGDDLDSAALQGLPGVEIEANARDTASEAARGWTGFYYVFAAGSSLHTADYSMRQVYNPGACASVIDTAYEFLTLNLDLPDGARIDYLRMYYYDTAAGDSVANIRKYNGAGATTEIAVVHSASNIGYGTILSAYVGLVVDNSGGGYVLNWEPMVTGTTMRLCGLRVAYRLPN
jgi:hypothetical protein